MADQPTPPAGSADDETTPGTAGAGTAAADDPDAGPPTTEAPVTAPAAAPVAAPYGVAETPPDRGAWLRAKAPLIASAAALLLVGGLGGFAIGHAAGDDGRDGFRPADFAGQGPQRGQGPPSFRDGERGQLPQQDSGDEAS